MNKTPTEATPAAAAQVAPRVPRVAYRLSMEATHFLSASLLRPKTVNVVLTLLISLLNDSFNQFS